MPKQKAPGKAHREGISLMELTEMFPDEDAAVEWFEAQVWPTGRFCPHCGSTNTRETPSRKPMPYWCTDCRSYFSVRTGTALQSSRLPLRKWAFAIYLVLTNLKSVSSLKLHRDLKVTQKTAWFMIHRIREAWGEDKDTFDGPIEVDESYFGGKRKNMSTKLRAKQSGRGAKGKTAVVGVKDRKTKIVQAKVVENTKQETLQPFVKAHMRAGTVVFSDESASYKGLPNHDYVNHSIEEYVRGEVHINGMESFWSMLKRAHAGTFHYISPKHLQRYVNEFAGKHSVRDRDTIHQMQGVVVGLVGRRLMYRDLIA